MDTIETALEELSKFLSSLYGAPAAILVVLSCLVVGYGLKFIKRFPNDAIPLTVILWAAVFYPIIADDKNDLSLRVWLVRNVLFGLVCGFIAWLMHNKLLSKLEDRFLLFQGDKPSVPTPTTGTSNTGPTTTTPPIP